MSAPETLLRRAQREFSMLTDDSAKALAKWKVDIVRAVTIQFLQENGVVLVGDNTLVEYAIDRASTDVAVARDLLVNTKAKRKRGRPPVDFETLTIYAAAHWIFMDQGVSNAAAARKAAQFLGEPATKDRVEKGTKGWLRVASKILTVGGGEEKVRKFLLQTVSDTAFDLARISGELAAEKRAEAARRKSARHAAFNGAASAASLPNLKRETKR